MHSVSNTGKAPRTIHDATGRAKTINPGKSLPVELLPIQVARLQRDEALKFVSIPGLGEEEAWAGRQPNQGVELNGADPSPSQPPASQPAAASEAPAGRVRPLKGQVTELLTRLDQNEIDFPDFLERAQTLLGDAWPGGTPKKSVVVRRLKALTK